MREVAEITSETPKSRVPQKCKRQKRGEGWKITFPRPSPSEHLQLFKLPMQHIGYYQTISLSLNPSPELKITAIMKANRLPLFTCGTLVIILPACGVPRCDLSDKS